jgi:hypothetical protein
MDWQEEFNLAMAQFGIIVPDPIEYRIHYNELGNITQCTMQQHPLDTTYLVVDSTTYENYFRYRVNVARKKLEKIDSNLGINVKLKKNNHGYAVVEGHAGLVLEKDEYYENIEYYDTTN